MHISCPAPDSRTTKHHLNGGVSWALGSTALGDSIGFWCFELRGGLVDVVIYATAFGACRAGRKWRIALQLLGDMQKLRVELDLWRQPSVRLLELLHDASSVVRSVCLSHCRARSRTSCNWGWGPARTFIVSPFFVYNGLAEV